jgi:hypothetical protein
MVTLEEARKAHFAMKVKGKSMEPTLLEGDYIIIGTLTIEGKVKNFTNTTLQTVSLRFEFYDKNKQLVHTETRYVLVFERFRPNDVRAFREDFFSIPNEARTVSVSVEDVVEAW